MEGELIDLLREGGPLAVVSVVAIYLLLKERKNNRRSAENPSPSSQLSSTLARMERKADRSNLLLALILDRLGGQVPPE